MIDVVYVHHAVCLRDTWNDCGSKCEPHDVGMNATEAAWHVYIFVLLWIFLALFCKVGVMYVCSK
jgi:hypothetical protein